MWFRSAFQRLGPATESARIPPNTIVYAIGDVHGRLDLLQDAFRKIDADRGHGHDKERWIVMLGDYVDRGRGSRQVIDLLLEKQSVNSRLVCLRGNHEEMLLQVLTEPAVLPQWLDLGGRETLVSYGVSTAALKPEEWGPAFIAQLPAEHREFLSGLPLTFESGDYFFVHAGVRPGIPIDRQDPADLIWIRDEFLEYRKGFGKRIVHGHTPVREPEVLPHRIGIDTGAYITNKLTCVVLEGTEVRFL